MLPSLLAKALAPCLSTIQTQPISIGATSPSEALTFSGTTLPIIPPLALKATLANPTGPLTNLQPLRDQTMNQLYALYKNGASPAQQAVHRLDGHRRRRRSATSSRTCSTRSTPSRTTPPPRR